jgi:hypothetical protein
VQLKPSTKCVISGSAVEVKSVCCVVVGPCTWSKVKTCFLEDERAEDEAAAAAWWEGGAAAAAPEGEDVLASTATLVGEMAVMTVRWKRAGMEVESWFVGGRMRRAVDVC